MASNIYYGICTTAGNEQNKQVRLANVSSESEGLHLQKGDILSVYFVHKNEANGVTLTLSIGDINQEYNTSVSVDETVYNTGVINVVPGAWADGEVINFSYTHNGSVVENADNNYYWEMVGKSVATSDTYGNVLFNKVNEEDNSPALSKNKIDQLIASKGVKELSYEDVSTGSTVIGHLRLNTRYSNDNVAYQESLIDIKIPDLPENVSYFDNDANYIKNPIESSLLFNGTESNSKQIGVNTEGGIESGTIIIDLCDDSNSDTIINSLNDINLNPTGLVNITLPTNESQLNVSGGNGIACDKLDSADLFVDDITAHTSEGTITFHSPVNIPNGLSANGLQLTTDENITINTVTLPNYLANFLRTETARPSLNDWLADQLDGYLKTKRYYYGPTGRIELNDPKTINFGGDSNQHYYIENGTERYTSDDLKLEGYDIVGIIAWETFQKGNGANPKNANVFGIWWEGNDPSTGILHLKIAAVTAAVINTGVSVDILYKKKLRTTGE